MNTKKIILASGSPRRKQLLDLIGMKFTISVPHLDEKKYIVSDPIELACALALRKAKAVIPEVHDALIIGADTVVIHQNSVLGKPENRQHARKMLSQLSGKTHQVVTAAALVKTHKQGNSTECTTFHETTKVTFHELDDLNLDRYLATDLPMDKAGAYGIQNGWGALFVKSISGDFYNVVGLPLQKFYREMKIFAPEFLTSQNQL